MQEVNRFIGAGGSDYVDAAGDFIFCAFADRTFRIVIDGKSLTVNPGDKLRPQKRFQNFQIENLDDSNEMAVRLIVGEGDYNSQIIQGEVTVMPGVRGADGQWRDDTRHTIDFDIVPRRADVLLFESGTVISQSGNLFDEINPLTPEDLSATKYGIIQTDIGNGWALVGLDGQMPGGGPVVAWYDEESMDVESAIHSTVTGSDAPITYPNGSADTCMVNGVFYCVPDNEVTIPGYGNNNASSPLVCFWNPSASQGQAGVFFDTTSIGKNHPHTLCPFFGNVFLIASNSSGGTAAGAVWLLINPAGEVIRQGVLQESVSTANKARYSKELGGVCIACGTDQMLIIDPDTGDQSVIDRPQSVGSAYGWAPSGKSMIRLNRSQDIVVKQVFVDWESPVQLDIVSSRCDEWGSLTTTKRESFHTSAIVEGVTLENGSIKVTGQVIKAALEFYFKRQVNAEYMDSVYFFKTDGDLKAGMITVNGGANSLKKIEVEDNFSVRLPAHFTITIDQNLQLTE